MTRADNSNLLGGGPGGSDGFGIDVDDGGCVVLTVVVMVVVLVVVMVVVLVVW